MKLLEYAARLGVATTHPQDCYCPECAPADIHERDTQRHRLDIAHDCLAALPARFCVYRDTGSHWNWAVDDGTERQKTLAYGTDTFIEAVEALAARSLEGTS